MATRQPAGAGRRTPRASGRELERAAALERRGAQVAAPDAPPAPLPAPLDEEALGVTRRQVLNRGIVATFTLALSRLRRRLRRHAVAVALRRVRRRRSGSASSTRSWTRSPTRRSPSTSARAASTSPRTRRRAWPRPRPSPPTPPCVEGYEQGVVALYQKCPHLGCRVPWCKTSQWFECPCHGSQYNRVGEKKGGPAPRGMDRFAATRRERHRRRRHQDGDPRPAHRHQHHRPGVRGPPLHRCRRRALM